MSKEDSRKAYWKANLKLVALCLSIWFVVSYLFGIILVDQLNAISVGGYKLEEEGVRLFSRIDGDYFNVLGLPLLEILAYLGASGDLDI